jgi:hypothetical protein
MVNLTTAIRDASSMLTTSRERPLGFSRTCTETSSGNWCRCVSGSLAMGRAGATSPTAAPPEGAFAEATEPSLQPAANTAAIMITIILCDVRMRFSYSV